MPVPILVIVRPELEVPDDEARVTDESFSRVELVLLANRSANRYPLLLFIDAYQANADPLQRAARKGSQQHDLVGLDGRKLSAKKLSVRVLADWPPCLE